MSNMIIKFAGKFVGIIYAYNLIIYGLLNNYLYAMVFKAKSYLSV